MVVRSFASPPTPWSKTLAEPKIDPSSYVHSFSNIIGDVYVGANVLVAPGTSIRADEGTPFYIGEGTRVQDGVVIHGLEKGKVAGDDGNEYSVWVGKNSSLAHMTLVHGPAYIGDDCFVGFRSTIFNARIGNGCIVGMHVLVQDVEIAPGKYVPSGAIITNQQQADRLPEARTEERQFVNHVVGINHALRIGHQSAADVARIAPMREPTNEWRGTNQGNGKDMRSEHMRSEQLNGNISQQVRQLIAQGYRVGAEYADERRFRTSSWHSCTIEARDETGVLNALSNCLSEHRGEYVRLIGIDTTSRRRVLETIVQRPGEAASIGSNAGSSSYSYTPPAANVARNGGGRLTPEAIAQVRQLLAGGYRIGTEHADERRFRTSSWHTCAPIDSTHESTVIAALDACLQEHAGEYVRLIGIDTRSRRRVAEIIVQRPNGPAAPTGTVSYNTGATTSAPRGSGRLSGETIAQVRQLLSGGYRIGLEHADERRFRTSSWYSASIEATGESGIVAALESLLQQFSGEYVRLIGIDTKTKRRVAEVIIQRPDGSGTGSSNGSAPSNGYRNGTTTNGAPAGYASPNNSRLSAEIANQIRNLLSSGYRVGAEYADERRFRTSSWYSEAIDASTESGITSAVEACLSAHTNDYVRLIGIDPKSKRRVAETVIHRPKR